MKTTSLSESTVRRRAKRKGLLLQKGRSHPPHRKPYRVVCAGEIRFGTIHNGQSLAECADFIDRFLPSLKDIKARLRALDARRRTEKGGFKHVRGGKVWKGIKFAPVSGFHFEIAGTTMTTAPLNLGQTFTPVGNGYEHH